MKKRFRCVHGIAVPTGAPQPGPDRERTDADNEVAEPVPRPYPKTRSRLRDPWRRGACRDQRKNR